MTTIGIIGDTHAPFTHPMYRRFCQDTFEEWGVDEVIHIGDVVDAHALSFWDHDPDGMSASQETEWARQDVAEWHTAFPDIRVCIGNHDERHFRKAKKSGIPHNYLRGYADVWETPTWEWGLEFSQEGVLYVHGTGTSGKDAAYNRAIAQRHSLVMGHVHSYAGSKYHANPFSCIFGLNVGCGIDIRAYAFDYGKMFPVRPILGCGVVMGGSQGFFVPMPCGDGKKYHRDRAPKKLLKRTEAYHSDNPGVSKPAGSRKNVRRSKK